MTSHHVEHYKGCLLDCTPLEAIKGQFLAHVSISHASAPERILAQLTCHSLYSDAQLDAVELAHITGKRWVDIHNAAQDDGRQRSGAMARRVQRMAFAREDRAHLAPRAP
jgi:hypothetical protein